MSNNLPQSFREDPPKQDFQVFQQKLEMYQGLFQSDEESDQRNPTKSAQIQPNQSHSRFDQNKLAIQQQLQQHIDNQRSNNRFNQNRDDSFRGKFNTQQRFEDNQGRLSSQNRDIVGNERNSNSRQRQFESEIRIQDRREEIISQHNQDNIQPSGSKLGDRLKSAKRHYEREDYDYIRQVCKKAQTIKQDRELQEREDRRIQRKREEQQMQIQKVQGMKLNQQKSVDQRIMEAKRIAEFFYLLNETNWCKFEDTFYIMNRRWFDRWKDYISYDYIMRFLIEQEISNLLLLLDKKDHLQNKLQLGGKINYCNTPLKNGLTQEKDFFLVSESIWKFLSSRYKGEEILRYAIYKNQAGVLDRQPYLPTVNRIKFYINRSKFVLFQEMKQQDIPSGQSYPGKLRLNKQSGYLKMPSSGQRNIWMRKLDFGDYILNLETQISLINLTNNFPLNRETLFVEVRKIKTIWLFDLDFKDNKAFDEGSVNIDKHLVLYQPLLQDENWQSNYTLYYKYHNNTQRDYWDISYTTTDLYQQFKQQLNINEISQSKVEEQKALKYEDPIQNNQNSKIPQVKLEDKIKNEQKEDQSEELKSKVVVELKHQLRCTSVNNVKMFIIAHCNASLEIRGFMSMIQQDQSQASSIKVVSDEEMSQTDHEGEDSSSSDEFSSDEDKDKFKSQKSTKESESKSILKFDDIQLIKKESQVSQSAAVGISASIQDKQIGKRKRSDLSNDSGKIQQDLSLSINKRKKVGENQKSDKPTYVFQELPFKFDHFKERIFQKPRSIQTQDQAGAKIASLLTVLTQLNELRDSLTIEQGPLNAIIRDVLNRLIDSSQIDSYFTLPFNKIERHLDVNQDICFIIKQMVVKLAAQNQSLLQMFQIKQKFSEICINCGTKRQNEKEDYLLQLQNEADDQISKHSVRLKIIYLYDYDQFKKYEIQLKPGEYTFQDVMGKIKEKVQVDRPLVKSCKKCFILVDLLYENSMYGQMFSNEGMKFNFRQDQSLTTFAYEVSKTQKDKIKRQNFVHIAKADQDGRITYHCFPRLIMYQESDQLKTISGKIFKGLRTTLATTSFQMDPLFMQQSETESYNQLFSCDQAVLQQEPYEMVLVLKDGSRWKLDPNQKQKLSQIVDVEMIVRFEVIFPVTTSFDEIKTQFKAEFDRQIYPEKELGLRDLNLIFRKHIRQCIVGGENMSAPCSNCKEQKGAQQVNELMKLSNHLVIKVQKIDQNQITEYPLKLSLDKFMSKSSQQLGNEYQLVGCIGQILKETINQNSEENQNDPTKIETVVPTLLYYSLIYNSQENLWYRYDYGMEPTSAIAEVIIVDDKDGQYKILLDKQIDFLIYKKVRNQDNKQFGKK
ncbi:spore germination protein ia [Stylonychia lemnae]|uniref:Spore germination protein ia n=1 Tax=Stylonychia lemnae TaxID=5949 RepID=A0A078A831_STYLE|nr:spore germination protein ia [Stylonychia lemnae]|eukprot:CDW77742.1 spore germination protein ia [Stylonychia lemnae]